MKLLPKLLIGAGTLLIISSVILFIYIFAPIFSVEFNYNINKPKQTINDIKPVDKSFGIIIPKIGANSKIIANVDPYNSYAYQAALTKGVAQAKGSAFPNQTGNMFLFSHSSANILEAKTYNSIFYLLTKLVKDDEIYVYHKDIRYKYKVTDIKIVDASSIKYLSSVSSKKQITLMTCWPAGTTYKRLVVIAEAI